VFSISISLAVQQVKDNAAREMFTVQARAASLQLNPLSPSGANFLFNFHLHLLWRGELWLNVFMRGQNHFA
jgi:hypothetical protein